MKDLQYPIGTFDLTQDVQYEQIEKWINEIEALPSKLGEAISGWDDGQLDTAYRPGGWTVRQVIHHLADSHLNGMQRFKLALTEENPVITPYKEDQWAILSDYKAPVSVSMNLLSSLHERWVIVLRSLGEAEFDRAFIHPEIGKIELSKTIGMYAWHGNHHLAHITNLALRNGWKEERNAH
ncbi:YfiT family bacillithiol transferase [Fictibacillus iocasae]|uniref:Putative metal-dependent hydrolase ACFQPF_02800 n=1 Tax=Fictibacillus iocasae TaxID=2715437 RepID=A0ABW2NMB1_9BACL